jgi:hypothetical protein
MPTVKITPTNREPYYDEVKILGKRKLGNETEYSVLVQFSNFTTQYMPIELVNDCPDLNTLSTLKGTLE